jgi:hypothetical protein
MSAEKMWLVVTAWMLHCACGPTVSKEQPLMIHHTFKGAPDIARWRVVGRLTSI